jgi:carboxyl-terminal processing protease
MDTKYNIKTVACVLLIGVAFVAGFHFQGYLLQDYYKTTYSIDGIDFSLLQKAWNQLGANYVDQTKIDKEKMTYGAVEGMVKAIGDPYTEFFNPEEARKLEEDLNGTFEGVGIQIGSKDDSIKIISPIKGTPGERAGLRPGDTILAVDEKPTSDLSIDQVVSMIRGPKGSKVVLTILREKDKGSKDIEITRALIKVPTIEWKIVETENGKKIAHLNIFQFSDTVYQDFTKAGFEILDSNVDGIILDLRSNPGGLVNHANSILGWFVEKGQIILSEKDKDGNETKFKSNGPSSFLSYPLVILINEGSASASEIVAGAIKDIRDVPIIGQKSFGKGTVQKVINLDDGSIIKITIAKWFTPKGIAIQDTGITPNIEIEMTGEDYDNNLDPQMDKALEEIEKIIK